MFSCLPLLIVALVTHVYHFLQGSEGEEEESEEEESESEEEWGSDSDESSSSDSEAGAYSQLKGRARWLKKNIMAKEKVVKNKEERGRLRAEAKEAAARAEQALESSKATKSLLPVESMTPSLINKKVFEVVSSRGRRGTDTRQVLRQLEALSKLSLEFGPRVEIPILMHVVTAQFDLQRTMDDYMPTKTWKSCANYLYRISCVLEDGYKLGVAQVDESEMMMLEGTDLMGKKMTAAASAAEGGAMAAVAADEKLVNPHTVRKGGSNCGIDRELG
jgi:hypothetical protein